MNQGQHYYVPQCKSIVDRINSPPFLVQCVAALNEEEFIRLTLRSIYKEVDQIILVHGAIESNPRRTPDGKSIDRTGEIIRQFRDVEDIEKKILLIELKRPFKSLEEQKQVFLDVAIPGSWLIINDADEFYRPEDIRRLRVAIDRYPHVQEWIPVFLHTYKDFHHIAKVGPEWQPLHQRVFKVIPGMKYNSHAIATLPNGECSYFSPWMQSRRFILNNFFIHHLGYSRLNMDQVLLDKQKYYATELVKHGDAHLKFDAKVKAWSDNTEPIWRYTGELPEVLKSHPMYGQQVVTRQCEDWSSDDLYGKYLVGKPFGSMYLNQTGQAFPPMNFFHNEIKV